MWKFPALQPSNDFENPLRKTALAMENVRVRFAPSPTGALHIGGVRTALFNYLFAQQNQGSFVLRIEDTDQTRYVEGAEEYIRKTLQWLHLTPDESPWSIGDFEPYRQSERKEIYQKHAALLIQNEWAYYAFDTPEELDAMREELKATKAIHQQYNAITRMNMKNSLTLPKEEVEARLKNGEPYVIRFKVPMKEDIRLHDLVRGWVKVHSSTLDDKILMKSDGMPTYHLANVVDDYLMKITHVIRGEEWLPSAPLHYLLYRAFGWEESMPKFAHLPLILKPDGNGKLSKRAADKAGFPIFPFDWKDPETGETSVGFRESGYLPEALINFLAFLGWNPGTEQELFSMSDMVGAFSLDQVNKSGTKFDPDKLKWYNQQYIKALRPDHLAELFMDQLKIKYELDCPKEEATRISALFRERVSFIEEMAEEALIFFQEPQDFDEKIVKKKLNKEAARGLELFAEALADRKEILAEEAKTLFSNTLQNAEIAPGKVMQTLRLVLTGQGGGPDLMQIIEILGSKRASDRIKNSLKRLHAQIN
jgi:glutamyl-tRNA synthetase